MRTPMLTVNTRRAINSAPPQARLTQLSYGLNANWKITTGRLPIGSDILVLKNWLFSAVNNSGAVSPVMRAIASSTPVTTPDLTERKVTLSETCQRGAPTAKAASRRLVGTSLSMFSVVRTTTGMAISASATDPPHAEHQR